MIPHASLVHIMQGIAWDKGTGKIWVTGKQWPGLHEVKITQVIPCLPSACAARINTSMHARL